MSRLLIQSRATGRFLCPNPETNEPHWVVGLRQAGGGVMDDMERIAQLMQDHTEYEDLPQVIDLDRLGTPNDY
jgi:hypothetical protein